MAAAQLTASLGCSAGGCSQSRRFGVGATAAAPRAHRGVLTCALSAPTTETPSESSWFTQFDSFSSVGGPSQRAQRLENSFWHHPVLEVPSSRDEAVVLMERLQHETATLGSDTQANVVAFTGGNGPALAAYLLNSVFDGAVVACIGSQDRLQPGQLEHAQYVTELLGIELFEVDAELWSQLALPQAVSAESNGICEAITDLPCDSTGMAVFSGATADDLASAGCLAKVQNLKAPLAGVSRATVNALSKVLLEAHRSSAVFPTLGMTTGFDRHPQILRSSVCAAIEHQETAAAYYVRLKF